MIGRKRVYTYAIELPCQAVLVMVEDGCRASPDADVRNGELKARQERQQGSSQQKVLAGAGTWGGNRDQLCLKLAGLLRSPRAFCRNVCGWKAGEDRRFGSPPLGSSSCPPLQALLGLLRALSLLWSTPPPTHSDHDHATYSDIVTKCPPLFNHGVAIYNVPSLH